MPLRWTTVVFLCQLGLLAALMHTGPAAAKARSKEEASCARLTQAYDPDPGDIKVEKTGKVVFALRDYQKLELREDYVVVKTGGQWYLADCEGRVSKYVTYNGERHPYGDEGMQRVVADSKIGFTDLHGELIIPPRYERSSNFCGGFAKTGSDCGLRDATCMDEARIHTSRCKKMTCEKVVFINRKGEPVAEPPAGTAAVVNKNLKCSWSLDY